MPNGSAFDDAVRIAKENPDLGVGVHLSLVAEKSVAPVGDLNAMVSEDGLLPENYSAFARQFMARRFSQGDVRTEILAQVDKALATGIKFTHIDSHQHLHMLPGIFDMVLREALDAGIPAIRVPLERGGIVGGGLLRMAQTWVLSRISQSRLRQVRSAGMHSADWFWGLGVSGKMNEANLMDTLGRLCPGVNEIMCHPGISDEATLERYHWGYSWDDELAALTSEKVRGFIESNDIRLASFADAWS